MFSAPSLRDELVGHRGRVFVGFDDIVADIHREYQSTIATEPPPRLPESPQRGEFKAAHDLDDEREKQCNANATVERKFEAAGLGSHASIA